MVGANMEARVAKTKPKWCVGSCQRGREMDDNPKGGCGEKTTTLFAMFICAWQTLYKINNS